MAFSFEEYLRKKNLSQNTIKSYLFTVNQYQSKYLIINKKNLQAYKTFLVENYKIKTVNLRIQAINTYLKYLKKDHLKFLNDFPLSMLAHNYQLLDNKYHHFQLVQIYYLI